MQLLLLIIALAFPAWATEKDKPAIKIPPYQIPTFSGKENSFKQHGFAPPMKPAPNVDSDLLYRAVVNCFNESFRRRIISTHDGKHADI